MLNFLIAPDFPPEYFAGWHMFNTQLQRLTDNTIHLHTPADYREQNEMINGSKITLIYANPFDASALVRDKGYLPLARPINKSDEMIIATYADSPYNHSDELTAGCRILVTENHDIELIGLRLLESAGLTEETINFLKADTFQEAARRLIAGEAEAAFFLASTFRSFSRATLGSLKILMESHINDLSHVVLLHPDYAEFQETLRDAFVKINTTPAGQMVLEDLSIPEGFAPLSQEDAEFMIDLIETLRD
ncbi:phosphate/phosphite/phosphonate ABC transporter substrate-binding protein [Wielerella bovis]|uniref:PhnD/SsuA/transferrin family substrate-binding protein n=1 Tax=Wielerella bovis TaxID=2917790 RepID=UPI002018D388|nr:PhnD/SsuA/transferrin family substrate-binding protein [Wielerella bovis]ULJ69591.1 phosphate/phosphite/phosphonate ABC transporter substrate-binding protein [Wielerella bovis]